MSPHSRDHERRKKHRVQLTRGLMARFGSTAAVIVDVTDSGARIEHFTRLDVGRVARFRFQWESRTLEVEARVVACRLHRFAHGEDGATIYQSGLCFDAYHDDAQATLSELVEQHVARSLAEQVANARGIGPVIETTMPVFRAGVVIVEGRSGSEELNRLMQPGTDHAWDHGFVRCTLVGDKWEKKWTSTPEQPDEGFTVLASEPSEHIDELCTAYLDSVEEDRAFIRALARVSVSSGKPTPETR